MIEISIKKSLDDTFCITRCAALSRRNKMRLNILLNSLQHIRTTYDSDEIILSFDQTEPFIIAKTLRQIIDYLSSLQCSVAIEDTATVELLQKLDGQEATAKNRSIALRSLRADKTNTKTEFMDFCRLCDSLLKIKLREYQYKAAYLLVEGMGGFDFSVPGAGKTIISYVAYAHLKQKNIVDRILVIGPASSYNAWYDEFYTCFGQQPDFENLGEATVKLSKVYLTSSVMNHKEITFINIDKIRLLSKELNIFLSTKKTMLIIDEAHKIKNPQAKVTDAALDMTKSAEVRIALTGTPMPNGYEDLFTLTKFISPFFDVLPYSYKKLKALSKNETSCDEIQKLRESIRPYFTRISKKYLLTQKELLPAVHCNSECEMHAAQRKLYSQLDNFCGKISDDLDDDILFALKKAVLIRKMQISANPALLKKSILSSMDELRADSSYECASSRDELDRLKIADDMVMEEFSSSSIINIVNSFDKNKYISPKNIRVIQLAAQLVNDGEKVLIWDIFVKNMSTLKKMLEKELHVGVGLINGTVSFAERQDVIASFKTGNHQILLANPATLAESISLHRVCQHAIYVNRNFNAAQFIQSKDRIHRINMPAGKTAHYYYILNRDSVDDIVDIRLKMKEDRMLTILDADDIEVGGAEFDDANIMSREDIEQSYTR